MTPIQKVLEALQDYTERGDEYRAKCPTHNGTSSDSLSIRETENGDVLLHCHAECESDEIVDALDLELADLFSGNGRGSRAPKINRTTETISVGELPGTEDEYFTFEDAEGNLLYIQRHKGAYYRVVGFDDDGDPLLAKGLDGVEPVLFDLPGLIWAVETGETVYHVEGCKDALNARKSWGSPPPRRAGPRPGRANSPSTIAAPGRS